jgi:hypothetical protein
MIVNDIKMNKIDKNSKESNANASYATEPQL